MGESIISQYGSSIRNWTIEFGAGPTTSLFPICSDAEAADAQVVFVSWRVRDFHAR